MKKRRAAAGLALLLLAATPALAARRGRLIGKVVDPEGKPIAGVTVTTTSPALPEFEEVATTDGRGVFLVDFERLGVVYRYHFEKAGYRPARVEQTWRLEGTERHQFTLEPAPAAAAAAPLAPAAPASSSDAAVTAFNAAVGALKAGERAAARAKFEEAVGHDPGLRPAWEALSEIHLREERHQEAAQAAEKAIALGSRTPEVLRIRWEAYRTLGDEARTAEAQRELERLGRLAEEAKRIHNEAVALAKGGDDAGAFAKFKEALAVDPGLEPALLGVATTGLEIGKPAEALAAAESLLEGDPGHAEALKVRYNAALKLGDEAKVVEALGGLAAVEPDTARSGLFVLAKAAFDRDAAPEARRRFERVLSLDPGHPQSHYYLGLLLMREAGGGPQARRYLERFLELAPGDPLAGPAREILEHLKSSR